uniref:Uncharacterized protein n=2 Tax=unclassified Microvirus TaxID=338099 RepID=A0AAU8AXL9_9VIRU
MNLWRKYFGDDAEEARNAVKNFRSLMTRLGYKMTYEFSPKYEKFLISLYDSVDDKFLCRMYTFQELRCITTASNIFWRYVR